MLLRQAKPLEDERPRTEQQRKGFHQGVLGSHKGRHLSFFEKDFSLVQRQHSIQRDPEAPQNVTRDLRSEFNMPSPQPHKKASPKMQPQRSQSFYSAAIFE